MLVAWQGRVYAAGMGDADGIGAGLRGLGGDWGRVCFKYLRRGSGKLLYCCLADVRYSAQVLPGGGCTRRGNRAMAVGQPARLQTRQHGSPT